MTSFRIPNSFTLKLRVKTMFAKYFAGSRRHCLSEFSELSQLIGASCLSCVPFAIKKCETVFGEILGQSKISLVFRLLTRWLSDDSYKEELEVSASTFLPKFVFTAIPPIKSPILSHNCPSSLGPPGWGDFWDASPTKSRRKRTIRISRYLYIS